jgi:hypothetical protein
VVCIKCVSEHPQRFRTIVTEGSHTRLDVLRGDSSIILVDELNPAIAVVASRAGHLYAN